MMIHLYAVNVISVSYHNEKNSFLYHSAYQLETSQKNHLLFPQTAQHPCLFLGLVLLRIVERNEFIGETILAEFPER